ncbi:MAG: DUF427 domain-containing protein [Gammaproteobacteria bacterium]|nr:DUF427 domain-containing protein [Gammaproteobacteria bacterium]
MWKFRGQKRPAFADVPGPGQESVWDYPRPPSIEPETRLVEVRSGSELIARSTRSLRVCETASPPTFYLPPDEVTTERLHLLGYHTFCEWKGQASYWALADDDTSQPVAWSYPSPSRPFKAIGDWLCFYPGRVDCFVEGESVQAQHSEFYGGWVTADIVGPFKGDPGTSDW